MHAKQFAYTLAIIIAYDFINLKVIQTNFMAIKKITKPKLLKGFMYTSDKFIINSKLDFKKILKNAKGPDVETAILSRGAIILNKEFNNMKIKFDFDYGQDYYGGFFTGFLYPDGSINGKIKWNIDAKMNDAIIDGVYSKISKTKYIICCTWTTDENIVDYMVIELSEK